MPILAERLQTVMETEKAVARDLGRHYAEVFAGVQDGETLNHVIIPIEDEHLNVLYRESAVLAMMEDQRFSLETPAATLAYALAGTIVKWDLVGTDGETMPLTPAALETLGQLVLLNVWFALAVTELAAERWPSVPSGS